MIIMKNFTKLLISSVLCVNYASAEAPPKPNMGSFRDLLTNSPFGKKAPDVVAPVQVVPQTTTYTLTGVSATADGWLVGIKDKKDPKKNIRLRSNGDPVDGISIVEVKQNRQNYRNTEVIIRQGGSNFSISFDTAAVEKSIQQSVKSNEQAIQQAQAQTQPQNPPGEQNNNQENSEAYRQARENMMREAAELRKMRESGNTGEDYEQRRKELMEKANQIRQDYHGRRRGGDENGRDNNGGGERRR